KLTVLAAGDPLVEINNDVCKIITERTVFYHIREKAKSFPSLAPKSTTEYLEYEETLNLIRKHAKSNILQKENVLIIDSDAVKPQLKAATQEKQHKSPGFANRQLCLLESEVADPFRGFKRVFLFL
ncbi:hypothetical protein Tco_0507651, partial [Tanacetum coccineum]